MPASDSAWLAAESLTHRYGERVALRDVSFTVRRGELFGLLGPNGGGKTTLFRILCTLLRPTAGRVTLGGGPVDRRQIGVVFQSPSLDKKLTVRENLLHQGHLYGWRGSVLAARIAELLERFRLADRAGDAVEKLSGGLRRRVELAKGLLHRPAVLLLDEPSTGLDPRARRELGDYLTQLARQDGVTVVLTTHLMEEADRCDRLAILDQGRLVALETPGALKDGVGGDVISVRAKVPESLRAQVQARFGVAARVVDGQVRIERARGHEFVPQLVEAFPGEIESVSVGKPTLEDVFIHLTGRRFE
jgi:ABC-2 type transport system ATP-binding protein